jgi:hypothetical protein
VTWNNYLWEDKKYKMEDHSEEKNESYEEVKASVTEANPQDAEEEEEEEPKPKAKPKAQPKAKPEPAKPGKNDKVECENCGKTMNANTLRYRHVCKPAKSKEIQKEKPRKRKAVKEQSESEASESPRNVVRNVSPETPRTRMLQYYREARLAQQEEKRARYRSWLGND